MKYAKASWDAERASWRAVIQLNLTRSIITIVEALQAEMDGDPIDPLDTPVTPATPMIAGKSRHVPSPTPTEAPSSSAVTTLTYRPGVESLSRSSSLSRANKASLSTLLTGKHQLLKLRLGSLRSVEEDLKKVLGEGADEVRDGAAESFGPLSVEVDSQTLSKPNKKEFGVRKLHEALERSATVAAKRSGSLQGHGSEDERVSPGDSVDEATEILASCHDDMKALWSDEAVKVVLKRRKLSLEDAAGLYVFVLGSAYARYSTIIRQLPRRPRPHSP